MSNTSNQFLQDWEAVLTQLRRHTLLWGKRKLSGRALVIMRDAYFLWSLATCDILQSAGLTTKHVSTRWLMALVKIDVKELALSLKDADAALIAGVTSYDDLKHHLRGKYPFIGDLLSPIKQIIERWCIGNDTQSFRLCHLWLNFISHVNLPGLHELKKTALDDYLANEVSLQSEGFTDEEEYLITNWYPRDVVSVHNFCCGFDPRHGGGGTADAGRSLFAKYASLSTDYLINFFCKQMNYDPVMFRDVSFQRRAKLVMVPKSMLAYRTISMEPATLMWYQQGVLRAFVDDLKHRHNHPLRRRFRPEFQQPNRDLAWEGSIDGSYATIDLSSASDSVSWALVRKWFGKSLLYPWLLTTRSREVELPDGTVHCQKKYAPMGSALCFPVECIVFCAIVEASIKEAGGDPISSRYRVYGDDIVVESEYAPFVMSRLERNGFKVNTRKSFFRTDTPWFFRESCGGEYLDGLDVTPLRLSRRFAGFDVGRTTPSKVESLIELANDCYNQYPSVRRWCIRCLNTLPSDIRPAFNSSGEGGLFSTQPTNWHLRHPEWSQDLQTWIYMHGHSVPCKTPCSGPEVEDVRLFEHLRQTQKRKRLVWPDDRTNVDLSSQKEGTWARKCSPLY